MSKDTASKDEATDETAPVDYVTRGHALVAANLPTCTCAFDGTARSWRIFPPEFARHGLSAEGGTPEIAIKRCRFLLAALAEAKSWRDWR